MRPLDTVLGAALMLFTGALPPIRHVARMIDSGFASRLSLCPRAAVGGGLGEANDSRRSVIEFLGPGVAEILVHQIGDSFPDFVAVKHHIQLVLTQRPQVFSRYPPWAEATPLAANGILGTIRYTPDRIGRFEISGQHLCVQDSLGGTWWVRVAPVDVWP